EGARDLSLVPGARPQPEPARRPDERGPALLRLEPPGPAGKLRFYFDSAGALGLARQDGSARLSLYRFDGQGFVRAGEHVFDSTRDDFWMGTSGHIYSTSKNALSGGPLMSGKSKNVYTSKEPIIDVRNVKGGDDFLVVHRSGALAVMNAKTE